MTALVDKHEAAKAIGISHRTLKDYRQRFLTEGLHYHWYNSRTVRYDLEAVVHWATHRNDPTAHRRWLENRALASISAKAKTRRKVLLPLPCLPSPLEEVADQCPDD